MAEKGTQSPVNEQALLAHDLRDCEEMLEQISSCLDRESERFVSAAYLEGKLRWENNIEMNHRKMCFYSEIELSYLSVDPFVVPIFNLSVPQSHCVCVHRSVTMCQPTHSPTQIHE